MAYQELENHFKRLSHFHHLSAIAGWDYAAMMPPKGSEARSAALAELSALISRTMTEPAVKTWLTSAEQETLSDLQRANLREMRLQWEKANLLPPELIQAEIIAGSKCEHAWRTQRKENDWSSFLENFRPVVQLARERAKRLSDAWSVSPYDALMQQYEPGMNTAKVTDVFNNLKSWLPALIQQVVAKQRVLEVSNPIVTPSGTFSIEKQKALGVEVMKHLGFDFQAGRLDVSTHPFCGGVPQDVRITTRYREDNFTQSLMGIIHETGHARYEQNLPRDWTSQPLGQARSMGIHESQSLSFEMQLGCSPAFLEFITPIIRKTFADDVNLAPALTPSNLQRLYGRVEPGYIRVDADELTYPMHIILRFEIEQALIDGSIEPDAIPELWEQKMQKYLGVDTRGNYRDGCMQDIHWTDGAFGYFPSYTLGAMYAAQYFATIRRKVPDLDDQIRAGQLTNIFDWLDKNIWSQASRWETQELVERATGEKLNPDHFKKHLENRYLHMV